MIPMPVGKCLPPMPLEIFVPDVGWIVLTIPTIPGQIPFPRKPLITNESGMLQKEYVRKNRVQGHLDFSANVKTFLCGFNPTMDLV